MQQLAGVVPFVERLRCVEALVTLEPDEVAACPGADGPGQLRLSGARFALEQQRPLHAQREQYCGGETFVGEIALSAEARLDIGEGEISECRAVGHVGEATGRSGDGPIDRGA
ncbi:unannotated protein [freshwater metagenome]|uniref:Unannotated protein n=1 Tax=freshwater metagenome TaxID=449393 RepID=A0A6J5YEA2_9ZZZZ